MKKVKITILAIAMLQMISAGLNAGLSALQEAFPSATTLQIQLATSCIGIIVLLMSLITDKIYARFTRRNSVIFALGLMAVIGIVEYFYHPSLLMIYIYSALLGISLALYIPAVGSVIVDCFSGEERTELTGNQSAFCSLGGIIISYIGGVLASYHWYASYLIFLVDIPALILTMLYFPKDNVKATTKEEINKKTKIDKNIYLYGAICLAFTAIYGACGNNLSLFVAEENLGSTVLAGLLGSIGMIGGVVGGTLFGKGLGNKKEKLFPYIFLIEGICFVVLTKIKNITALSIIVFVLGLIQCIMMPCCLLCLTEKVVPSQTVLASSIICAVAPNLSGVLSPLIITNLSEILFSGTIRGRFIIATVMALMMVIITYILNIKLTKEK